MLLKIRNKLIIINFTVILLSGCMHEYIPQPDDPRYAPIIPDVAIMPEATGGALYVEDSGLSLYQDMKAHRVGDIITVKLKESTAASKDAATNFKKEYTNDVINPTLFGFNSKFRLPKLPFVNSKNDAHNLSTTIDSSAEFKGTGDSGQNNSLMGDITVTVAQILPNKNLLIKGEKWLTLNQGSEFIRLSGIVRPQDIGPDNVVLSTRIADPRITYSGRGAVADSNKSGFMARFFNTPIWPF